MALSPSEAQGSAPEALVLATIGYAGAVDFWQNDCYD